MNIKHMKMFLFFCALLLRGCCDVHGLSKHWAFISAQMSFHNITGSKAMHTSHCRQCLHAHSNYKMSFRGLICSDLSLLKGTFQNWWEINLKKYLRLHANNVSPTEDFAITSCIHPSFAGFNTDLTLSPGWVHSPFLFFSTYSSHTSPALYLFLVISSYVPSFFFFSWPFHPLLASPPAPSLLLFQCSSF